MFFCNNSVYATTLKILGTMLLFCGVAVLVVKLDGAFAAVIKSGHADKEMLLAFVVHRHGERTPAEEEADLSKDVEKIKQIIKIDGYEALTNEGKRRSLQLGTFIRERYGSDANLISKLYIPDEIYLRTTSKDRTKMTAQISMASVYPPEGSQKWDGGLGSVWQPIPYTALPLSEDYLRYYSNCDYFKDLLNKAKNDSLTEELSPFMDLIPLLEEHTGKDFTQDPLLFQTLSDLFRSQVTLGLTLPEWSKPILTRLEEAAYYAYRLYFKTDEMKRIGGGIMLNDFIGMATEISQDLKVNQRLRVYSSHDFNIGSFMSVCQVDDTGLGIPEYAALFAMELYRSRSTGQFYVLPIYLPQAGNSHVQNLMIRGCGEDFCELKTFINLTKEFVMSEREFDDLCNIKTRR